MAELERKIGQQTMEIDFLRSCLRQIEDLRRSQADNPNSALCRKIAQERDRQKQKGGDALTTVRMTELVGVSRANYYRFDPETSLAASDVELRDAIQRVALRHPAYGRPRNILRECLNYLIQFSESRLPRRSSPREKI